MNYIYVRILLMRIKSILLTTINKLYLWVLNDNACTIILVNHTSNKESTYYSILF